MKTRREERLNKLRRSSDGCFIRSKREGQGEDRQALLVGHRHLEHARVPEVLRVIADKPARVTHGFALRGCKGGKVHAQGIPNVRTVIDVEIVPAHHAAPLFMAGAQPVSQPPAP